MITFPNAKINIGLQVIGTRPDGYHELETVFYPVSLYDALEVVDSKETKIIATGLPIPDGPENICAKAYALLQGEFDLPPVDIHLHKAIPMGAGLGGGSADGAFLIKLLNRHFSLGMDVHQMQEYARKLGADCAFFIENTPSFATGRGDQFMEVDIDLNDYYFAIIKPDIHISTAEAFRDVYINKEGRQLKRNIQAPVRDWRNLIVNDFERSVFDRYPIVGEIKDELYQEGAIYASMSGSGSAVFGIFEEQVTLTELAKRHHVLYC